MFPNVISLSISIWLPTYVSLETTYLVFCKKKKKEFAETVVKYFCGKIYMYFFREKVKKIR